MTIGNITYNTYALINSPKIHTDLLWDLSILFVGLGAVYFACIFFFRNRLTSKARKIVARKRELAPMVSEFLFHEDHAPKDEKSSYINLKIEIRELLKDDFNRKILSEILLDLQKDVSGETLQRLFKLYRDLGLHKDAFSKLKSWRWEVVSKGILELTKMQVPESYGFITNFINDRRGVIRKQAEIATVTLKHEGINYFLDTTRYRISEWQQLKLLDVIRNFEDFQPPKFRAWLTSKNKDVVLFALRLIKYYNQNDANASIIKLVKHRDNQIKTEAIGCIKEFCVFEALETLKSIFWKCNVDIKLLALDAIGFLGKEKDIDFLQSVQNKENNFIVVSKALSAINEISPETIMPTEGMDTGLDQAFIASLEDKLETESFEVLSQHKVVSEEIITTEISGLSVSHIEVMEAEVISAGEDTREVNGNTPINDNALLSMDVQEEEIVCPYPKKAMDEIILEFDDLLETQDLGEEAISFDFLPLVVDSTEPLELEVSNDTLDENIGGPELRQTGSAYADDAPWSFLPLVVDNEEPPVPVEEPNLGNEESSDVQIYSESVFKQLYFDKDRYNKILLLDTIEDVGDKRELPLLMEIVMLEDNTVIRDRALEILNDLSGKNYIYIPEEHRVMECSDFRGSSVFKQLFYAGDANSKLMLLDEIEALGDEKEIHFLCTLLNHSEKRIRDRAREVKIILEAQISNAKVYGFTTDSDVSETAMQSMEIDFNDPLDHSFEVAFEESKGTVDPHRETVEEDIYTGKNGLMPLEFCFLLDALEIKPSKPSFLDIDFELTQEFHEKQMSLEETDVREIEVQIEVEGETTQPNSFLESIVSFSTRIMDRFNG
ncbi:MAG: hypothetical protein AAFZ89_10150 [Bacteroidota bacterium]